MIHPILIHQIELVLESSLNNNNSSLALEFNFNQTIPLN